MTIKQLKHKFVNQIVLIKLSKSMGISSDKPSNLKYIPLGYNGIPLSERPEYSMLRGIYFSISIYYGLLFINLNNAFL